MDKLVKLLNRFEKEKIISEGWRVDEDDEYFWRSVEDWEIVNWSFDPDAHWFFKYQIISKDFKFIERLVNNNKIALTKLYHDMRLEFWDYYWLLMQLAIQDEPIEFLISILK